MISRNTIIAFLLFTATMLGCIIILQNTLNPVQAQVRTVKRTTNLSFATSASSSTELLWIADKDSNFLVVYGAVPVGVKSSL